MTQQQKQNQLTNWLLGFITTISTGIFLFAWDTHAKLSILTDHDTQHTNIESRLNQKQDDTQLSIEDIKARVNELEYKNKTH